MVTNLLHNCVSCNINKIETSERGITPINNKIYWHIDEDYLSEDLDKYKVLFAVQKAFSKWQEFVVPEFESANDKSKASIVFRFMSNGNPSLPFPFEQDTLAYAFFPNGESLGLQSDIYINEAFNWQEVHTDDGFSLFKVIVHEIGHALGLEHSQYLDDILYPSYQPNNEVNFNKDTILGIYKLYGEKKEKDNQQDCLIFAKSMLLLTIGNKKSLSKINEVELVSLANFLGLDVSVKDLKSKTIERLLAFLSE